MLSEHIPYVTPSLKPEAVPTPAQAPGERDDHSGWKQTQAEMRRSEHGWFKLALGLHQFYLTTSLHVAMAAVMVLSTYLGLEPLRVTLWSIGLLAASDILLYAVFKSGYNLRFRDPTLTVPRTVFIVGLMLYVQIYVGPTKACCALTIITTFVLAGSHSGIRTMTRLNLLTVAAYAATIPLMKSVEGPRFNGNAEFMNWLSFTATLSAAVFAGATISVLRKSLAKSNVRLSEMLGRVTEMASTDELTKIYNRRYILEMMEHEVQRVRREGPTFSICLLDIDHFKRINDTYGHACGDAVLKAFAGMVDAHKRGGDMFARWGGEEFVLFMPQTSLATARMSAERIRREVQEMHIDALPPGSAISISIGVAEFSNREKVSDLIERADQGLYRAKQGGRNRVETAAPVLLTPA